MVFVIDTAIAYQIRLQGFNMRYFNLLRNFSNWWLYLAVKFDLTAADPLLFRTRSGVLVEVPRRLLQTFKEIFMDECYMRGMDFPFRDKPVVIDVGANAGFFTLFILSRLQGAKVASYEPVPVNFRQLERNLSLNRALSVAGFQKAVAGQAGEVTLYFDSRDEFTTAATIYERQGENTIAVKVAGVSLPDIFRENNMDKCDLLKMDCEGAEYDILYNCPSDTLERIQSMAMEVHGGTGPGQDIDSLEAYLNKRGFATRRRPVGMLWAWRK